MTTRASLESDHRSSPARLTIEPDGDEITRSRVGLAYGLAAYSFWGLVAVYFKLLRHVAPLDVLAHRVAWSTAFLLAIVALQGRWRELAACLRSRRTMLALLASTIMIAVNWYAFIWAVTNGQVIEASLGYFMNPLVVVVLGVVLLRERLRAAQKAALVLAALAVGAMVIHRGRLPMVSLALAISFAVYGVLRKRAAVSPLVGLLVETCLMLPVALILIARQTTRDPIDARTWALLVIAGVVTALPLLWFAAAARRLQLSTIGFLQYLSPSIQFLLGRFVYDEPFDRVALGCFIGIWAALVLFSLDSFQQFRKGRSRAPAPAADVV